MSRHAAAVTPRRVPLLAPRAGDRLTPALLVMVVFLAGVGALLNLPQKTVSGPLGEHAAGAATRPLPRVRDGRVLVRRGDAGFFGVVLDRSDPTLLHLVVADGRRAVDCNVLRPVARITAQNPVVVRVVVAGYEYVPPANARSSSGGTTCVTAGSKDLTVRLRAPLGVRRVYDGSSPQSTTTADPADFPRLRPLPAGYTQAAARPVRPTLDRLVATRTYRSGQNRITMRIGSRFDVAATGSPLASTYVGDAYAEVTRSGARRCVTWEERSGRVRQVCAGGPSPMHRRALITVARSLR